MRDRHVLRRPRGQLIATGASVDVVRIGPSPELEDVLVLASLEGQSPEERAAAVDALNADDIVIVQHEYGLYDGPDGESIIELMAAIDAPILVVAHTVLSHPTANQRHIIEEVCAAADAVVVMTETARTRLFEGFDVDRSKVGLIPHGAVTPAAVPESERRRSGAPHRVLTWGLLGPGKGIEWAIHALDELVGLDPHPEYIVAGSTHPKVRARR